MNNNRGFSSRTPAFSSHPPSSVYGNHDGGADVRDIPYYKPGAGRAKSPSVAASSTSLNFDDAAPPPIRTLHAKRSFQLPVRGSSRLEGERPMEHPVDQPMEQSIEHPMLSPSEPSSRSTQHSRRDSQSSYETNATSLPALQAKGALEGDDGLEPLNEEEYEPGSYDLVAPVQPGVKQYSLETRSEQLFSTEHLQVIFSDPSLLLRFTDFLSKHRASSVPILVYYLDALKALKAIRYANAISEALDPIPGFDFTASPAQQTVNAALEEKANQAFAAMVREDLPAYITHVYVQTVSLSISGRITGTLPLHLREASEGLAEVFCLTDPSRPDNPIVFASEEFHRTTQYGMNYVIGRNCRFLQGPKTNPTSVRRLREKIDEGKEHCEVFLNYRRDGSPFMNMLMVSPMCDSRGKIRYFIGAQVDVSGLVKEGVDLESFKRLVTSSEEKKIREAQQENDLRDEEFIEEEDEEEEEELQEQRDEFQELSEMLNLSELDTVRKYGGRMHREQEEDIDSNGNQQANWNKPRLLIHDPSPDGAGSRNFSSLGMRTSGKLQGIYENYLLLRPYPHLRILFASPSLRVPGILQSPFMSRIGGSQRVKDELTQALADGRGVTAKVKWVGRGDPEGRNRWIHCTPLLGSNQAIGVWMVVLIDDERSDGGKKFKQAPPVDPRFGRDIHSRNGDHTSLRDFAIMNGAEISSLRDGKESVRSASTRDGANRAASPHSLNFE